jgi:SAM-dependent methyltransferase
MQNISQWKPTKVVRHGDGFRANPDPSDSKSYYVVRLNVPFYVEYISRYSSGRLLDCGCGAVPYYEVYRDRVNEIICTDWQGSRHGNLFIDEASDLNEKLNFSDSAFDTVILTDVLEHIYNPRLLLNEIYRVLKPGGKVIIAVPFLYRIHEEPHDYHRFTEYALRKMCEETGFSIVKMEPYGRYLDVLGDTLNKVFFRSRMMASLLFSMMRRLKKSAAGRKIDRAHGDRYALGYILCAGKPEKGEVPHSSPLNE